jgi:hypothetical protein
MNAEASETNKRWWHRRERDKVVTRLMAFTRFHMHIVFPGRLTNRTSTAVTPNRRQTSTDEPGRSSGRDGGYGRTLYITKPSWHQKSILDTPPPVS